MKTSEFKTWLTDHGYTFDKNVAGDALVIYHTLISDNQVMVNLAKVSLEQGGLFTTNYDECRMLFAYTRKALLEKLTSYAFTPIVERKDEAWFKARLNADADYPYFKQSSQGIVFCKEQVAPLFTPTTWNAVRGNLPAYDPENPLFEVIEDA